MKKSLSKQAPKTPRTHFFATRLEHRNIGGRQNVRKMRKVK